MIRWLKEHAVARPAEAKASKAGAVIALHTAGRPVWTPRTYAALARAGYMKNPVAYRAVRMVSEATASLTWLLYDGTVELDEHPLLALLKKPNPHQAGIFSRRSTGICSSPAMPMSRR
jgi:phage portal protein BeeE